ncbi:MAG: regulator of chromosome condensation, partial [Verrucomicrobiales bacterium]|nr:regulator of chromosome condensation [Verrucomicrobiales bacterium]
MKTPFGFRLLVLAAIAGCQSLAGHAATFTLTPATIPWNTLERVNLSVTGLSNHESILVEEFSDLNGNGILDSGEPLLLSFQAQDGEVPLFGGSRDTSRPGDEDGATNGLIRVELVLGKLPERNRAIGNYLFRISSPGNGFPPFTQAFNVTQASYGQSIGGKVMGGTGPISGAFIILMVNSGKDDEFFAGAVTDSSGNFNLNVPPGDYSLIALKSGYVCNVQTSPTVTVASGLNNTQNVSLLPASQNISGKIVDALNSNAIPGVQIFIQSQDGQAAFGGTDQSGNFSIPVTAGHWQVQPSEKALTLLGYNRTKLLADTTAANVSGLVMAL